MSDSSARTRTLRIGLGVGLAVVVAAAIPIVLGIVQDNKMAEGRGNLEAIVAGLEKLRAAHGAFVSLAAHPDPEGLGTGEQAWNLPPCETACEQGKVESCSSFECVGFRPHGDDAFFSYACTATEDGQAVTCAALGDLDGDGVRSLQLRQVAGPKGTTAPTPSFGGLAPPCALKKGATTARCPPDTY